MYVWDIAEQEYILEYVSFLFAKRTIIPDILDILMHLLSVAQKSQLIFCHLATLATKTAASEK